MYTYNGIVGIQAGRLQYGYIIQHFILSSLANIKGVKGGGKRGSSNIWGIDKEKYNEIMGVARNYIDCRYGCHTHVYHDKELGFWIEKWTGKPHTKTRCQIIQAKNKEKNNRLNGKHLRPSAVLEMKNILKQLPTGTSMIERIKAIFKERTDEADAVTITEVCAALFPSKMFKNETGEDEPIAEALNEVRGALSRLRKYAFNKDVTPFSVKKEDNCFYYYNVPTLNEYKPVKTRLSNQVFGVEETIDRTESMITLKESKVNKTQTPTEEELERYSERKKREFDAKKAVKRQQQSQTSPSTP